jgi:hypothetical protein
MREAAATKTHRSLPIDNTVLCVEQLELEEVNERGGQVRVDRTHSKQQELDVPRLVRRENDLLENALRMIGQHSIHFWDGAQQAEMLSA